METGSVAKQVHLDIGRQLASVADVVILIKNSVTPWVEEGIMNHELGIMNEKPQIIWFESAPMAHAALKNI